MNQIKKINSFTQFLQTSNDIITNQPRPVIITQNFFDEQLKNKEMHYSIDDEIKNTGCTLGESTDKHPLDNACTKKTHKKKQEKIELNTQCETNAILNTNNEIMTSHNVHMRYLPTSASAANPDIIPTYSATVAKTSLIKDTNKDSSSKSQLHPIVDCKDTTKTQIITIDIVDNSKKDNLKMSGDKETSKNQEHNNINKKEHSKTVSDVIDNTKLQHPEVKDNSKCQHNVTDVKNTPQNSITPSTISEPLQVVKSTISEPLQVVKSTISEPLQVVKSEIISVSDEELHSNEPIKNICTYETVIHDLGVLGRIEQTYKLRLINGRIAIDDRYLQALQRALTGDDRTTTMEYIKQLIHNSEKIKNDLVAEIIRLSSGATVAELAASPIYRDLKLKLKELIEKLKQADSGLHNLKITYQYDINIGVSFDEFYSAITKICDNANKDIPFN